MAHYICWNMHLEFNILGLRLSNDPMYIKRFLNKVQCTRKEKNILSISYYLIHMRNNVVFCVLIWSILVMWLACRFLDTEVDGSNSGISMLCP